MFGKKKPPCAYDPNTQRPVLKCSICTGEQVAGFKDLRTGRVDEVMLIRSEKDLALFRSKYGIPPDCTITKEY